MRDEEGRTSRTVYRYVICTPLRAPSSFSTQSFHQTDVAVRDPGGTHCITDKGNLDNCRGGCDLHNHDSDLCSYMLRIQTQDLCFKRSCKIYLFIGSGLNMYGSYSTEANKSVWKQRRCWMDRGEGANESRAEADPPKAPT